jgi:hypothetical protein
LNGQDGPLLGCGAGLADNCPNQAIPIGEGARIDPGFLFTTALINGRFRASVSQILLYLHSPAPTLKQELAPENANPWMLFGSVLHFWKIAGDTG